MGLWDTQLAALKRIVDELTSDQGEIAKISQRWRTMATAVTTDTGALNTAVGTVDDAWKGGAADNFVTYMAKYPKSASQLKEALTTSATKIDEAGAALNTARGDVQKIYTDTSTWLAKQSPKTDSAITSITNQVNAAVKRADEPRQRAIDAIDAAIKEINNHVDDKFFTTIPAPGDQDFYPKNKPNLHWLVDPQFKQTGDPTQPTGDKGNGSPNGGNGGNESGAPPNIPPAESQVPPDAKDLTENPDAQKILDYAFEQLGDPYVWGAEGPDSFDCSGLTQKAYEAAGIEIPRVANDQWGAGPRIPDGNVQAGDLIFFDNDGNGTADHVGIVVDPEKKTMVHAPNSTTVVQIADYGGRTALGFTRPGNS
ncbi:bifunctional WXG100 family type VII secretion target/C40 family peptidase [Nonomuraea cavernae]|uniref:NlpC/P60 domain-containing protein n=1 Tax=Nonomuraea cavernae TaxID=2045107 RepID=A0A918DNW6_9ACTN|nr:NlpC/P60 family protein [Nonomuraea cavernae]MCA2189823.1 NlpC/P60 family protein [Nonomuraea cavernae]GGO77595.1 hypothetical protein GCM10012289_57620 [Nonomuraea cavernae]